MGATWLLGIETEPIRNNCVTNTIYHNCHFSERASGGARRTLARLPVHARVGTQTSPSSTRVPQM